MFPVGFREPGARRRTFPPPKQSRSALGQGREIYPKRFRVSSAWPCLISGSLPWTGKRDSYSAKPPLRLQEGCRTVQADHEAPAAKATATDIFGGGWRQPVPPHYLLQEAYLANHHLTEPHTPPPHGLGSGQHPFLFILSKTLQPT